MRLRWALVSTAALAAVAMCCAQAGAVIGGEPTTTVAHPYQVALVPAGQTAVARQFCGGAVRDATHVITAAHCVFDNDFTAPGQPIAPGSLDVVAGLTTLSAEAKTPTAMRVPVAGVSVHPGFDELTKRDDAAILTLGAPLFDESNPGPLPAIAPIGLVQGSAWPKPPGTLLTVTGWGQTATKLYADGLRQTSVPLINDGDARCTAYTGFSGTLMVCAGDGSHDACAGDSGGPLVLPALSPANDALVGIVSYGPADGCAISAHPGVYTETYAIRDYLGQAEPVSAPRNLAAPAIQGSAVVGQTVRCDPGAWSDATARLATQFATNTSSGAVARTNLGSQSTYVVQPGDAASTIDCTVRASNDGGWAFAKSVAVAVPVPVAPAPAPAPSPPPVAPPKPIPQVDVAAPVARITSQRCKAKRCTLNVSVSDAGFSLGIAGVRATVRSRYRATCVRRHRRVSCVRTRTRTLEPARVGATRFRITARRLPFGRHRFMLLAVDRAGHVQALPTRSTLVTRRANKRR